MPTKHRGERLSQFLRNRGISYSQAAREIGRHRNTIDNWVKKENLSAENLLTLVEVYPELSKSYPELNLAPVVNVVSEPVESYTNMQDLSEACQKKIEHYRNKLESLQEKYDQVMEKYIQLLEERTA